MNKILVAIIFSIIFLTAFSIAMPIAYAAQQTEGSCGNIGEETFYKMSLPENASYEISILCNDPEEKNVIPPTTRNVYGIEYPKEENQQCATKIINKAERKGRNVIYYFDGGQYVFSGGSRAWGNNNPGNIRRSKKAIGIDNEKGGPFAIFSDYNTGYQELVKLLTSSGYAKMSIKNAIYVYAPPSENNPEAYAGSVKNYTGLNINRKLGDLNPQELKKVVDIIIVLEGFWEGKIVSDDCSTAVLSKESKRALSELCTNKESSATLTHSEIKPGLKEKIPASYGDAKSSSTTTFINAKLQHVYFTKK